MAEKGGGNVQKEKYSSGGQKIFVDQIKEDGSRKELYKNERETQKNWTKKWGFYKKAKELEHKEAAKRNLPLGAFEKRKNHENAQANNLGLLPSKGVPQLSSGSYHKLGMIGWRMFSNANNINLLPGPLYVSWKQTMNPPLGPDEPDLRHQRVIFLG